MRWKVAGLVGVVLMIGIGIAMFVGAVINYQDSTSGEVARAHITDCHGTDSGARSGNHVTCHGTWVKGGALVGGNGHAVVGIVDNTDYGDLGKTITVRLHGDKATKPNKGLSITLIVLGLFILPGGIVFARIWWQSVRPQGTAAQPEPGSA